MICKILCGSHLYGLNTPQSDTDYKGVFLPPVKDLILNRASHHIDKSTNKSDNRNTKDDIDFEMFSLHQFLHLVATGQPMAIEMMFAPKEMVVATSEIWESIVNVREQLLTRTAKSFVGYCKGQASKYCMKGDRLASLEKCYQAFSNCHPTTSLSYYFDVFCKSMNGVDYFEVFDADEKHGRSFNIVGKKFYETATIETITDSLLHTIDKYGERTRTTMRMEGRDWKAISHAVRIAVEVIELLTDKVITLPLPPPPREFIKKVKKGEVTLELVESHLDHLLREVEDAQKNSTLPSKFNSDLANQLIENAYKINF